MNTYSLSPAAHPGMVTIAVSSLDRSLDYYQQRLGFHLLERREETALLGTPDTALLALIQPEQAVPQPRFSTGLYHFAILLPSRADLAYIVWHLAQTRTPIDGMADHLVSEALYLSDPDGNGIELYRDRPRSEWPLRDGRLAMSNAYLDVNALAEEGLQQEREWTGLPMGTTLGHMHLRVGDIPQAKAFYHDLLGFDIMQDMMGSALFVSAGGYHHHIGLNTWESRNAPPPPDNAIGLRFYTIQLPGATELEHVYTRLQTAKHPVQKLDEQALALRDPWSNGILITSASLDSLDKVQAGLLCTI